LNNSSHLSRLGGGEGCSFEAVPGCSFEARLGGGEEGCSFEAVPLWW
jgi:hypothetical protein